MQFHFHANQSHFHKNGLALRLAFKQRHKGTRKWPVSNFETVSLKIISKSNQTLKIVMISATHFKMDKHSDFHLSFFQIVGAWQDCTAVRKLIRNFKSLYGFWGTLSRNKRRIDFEQYFKFHNLVSVYPRSIVLDQMTNLNMIFHVLVSVYRLVKIWNSPQFPDEFLNGQLVFKQKMHLQSAIWRDFFKL